MGEMRLLTPGRAAAIALAALLLSGCLGGPDVKTKNVMANLEKSVEEQIVVDRNYQVGQRFRVEPGQVMIRNKLYTLVAENAGAYRAELTLAAIGDGLRFDIAEGAELRVSDRMLVNGRLANLIALPAPPPAAPDVTGVFANADGVLQPAVLRGGQVVTFKEFKVQPDKGRLSPILRQSVKTSSGYTNYDLIYHGNAQRPFQDCRAPRTPGTPATPAQKAPPAANCGSGLHLDLQLIEYDPLQFDRIKTNRRTFYPVKNQQLQIPGLKVTIHEATPAQVVFEVTKDDNAYVKAKKL